jgi:hypothetical protein
MTEQNAKKADSPIKYYLQKEFLICVLVLTVSAIAMPMVIDKLGVYLMKLPLPLQKPFEELDRSKLDGYEVVDERRIDNPDVLEALGTDEYLQWTLVDKEAESSDPSKYCGLFLTYYTGNPDKVPHVPDECYIGGGHQQLDKIDFELDVPVKWSDGREETVTIPVRCLVFGSREGGLTGNISFRVFYFFKVNGKYAGNRNSTRAIMGANVASKYSYFSKVEWKFFNTRVMGSALSEWEQDVQASRKLMSELLVVLEEEHWADWEKANQQAEKE